MGRQHVRLILDGDRVVGTRPDSDDDQRSAGDAKADGTRAKITSEDNTDEGRDRTA